MQLLSCLWLFVTPWTAARQASLSFTISESLPKLMSTESVMPSNHLILCRPLLLLPSIFPSIRVFSNESALYIRWPKYWSFSFSISLSIVLMCRINSLDCLDCELCYAVAIFFFFLLITLYKLRISDSLINSSNIFLCSE